LQPGDGDLAEEEVERKLKAVLTGIDLKLKAHGFSKRGNAWRQREGVNVSIIEVQRSQASTSQAIHFTLNTGVVAGKLLGDWEPDVSKASSFHAHLRQRIGDFLDEPEDRWWTVEGGSDPTALIAELDPLLELAAAFLAKHITDSALIDFWETGASPGLTEGQRQRNLQTLKAAA
jgi:hypothetical protein